MTQLSNCCNSEMQDESSQCMTCGANGREGEVRCDDENCRAKEEPETLEEYKETLEHYKSHSLLSGCSHAR